MPGLPNLEGNVAESRCENQFTDERNWPFSDEMIRGSRTMITIKNMQGIPICMGKGQTYEGSHSRQELRLHGSLFRKTAANEDAIVSNLVGYLMSEARQCRSCADHGTRIKRCGQASSQMK